MIWIKKREQLLAISLLWGFTLGSIYIIALGLKLIFLDFWFYLGPFLLIAINAISLYFWISLPSYHFPQLKISLPFYLLSKTLAILILILSAVLQQKGVPLWLSPLWFKKSGLLLMFIISLLELILMLWSWKRVSREDIEKRESHLYYSIYWRKGIFQWISHPEKALIILFPWPALIYFNVFSPLLVLIFHAILVIYWIHLQETERIDTSEKRKNRWRIIPWYY